MKQKAILFSVILSVFASCASSLVRGQTSQQVLLKAAAAFSQGRPVNEMSLQANAEWIAGSDDQHGHAILTANADGSFNLQLQLANSSRTEAQISFSSGQKCTWAGSDGVPQPVPRHNCLGAGAWFLPAVALLGNQQPSGLTTSVLSQTTTASIALVGLRQQRIAPEGWSAADSSQLIKLNAIDFYFDPASYLISALSYDLHPDKNSGSDVPVQILFTDYRAVNGIQVPYRIQRYIHCQLNLDLTVTAASAN